MSKSFKTSANVATPDDDILEGTQGADTIDGGGGFDVILGRAGADVLRGGTGGDFVYGGGGKDTLYGDDEATIKGSDTSADRLSGGRGADVLILGDGNDNVSGGLGGDDFVFRFNDPTVGIAAGTAPSFTTIADYDAARDHLYFDVAGVGEDRSGANFVDGGARDGMAGGRADRVYTGMASGANGESVMVLTEQSFASGAAAAQAVSGEEQGDLILYFNRTVGAASLLVVDGPDAVHSIARFTDIDNVTDLRDAGFAANDFIFV